jgi:Xaa-Pro dipeptidase
LEFLEKQLKEQLKEQDHARIEKETVVRAWLKDQGIDGILFRKRSNFSWLTQGQVNHIVNTIDGGVADLLIFKDIKYCITSKMESRRIMEEELDGLGYELIEAEWYESTDELILKLCENKKVVSDSFILGLEDVSGQLIELRSQLNDIEIQKYKSLSQSAARAVESLLHQIEPGMTEYEIAAELARKVLKQGINPHVILVATDDRIYNYRHPIPTGKKLEKYAMVVICAEKGGLVTNVTRFVHFGELPAAIQENKRKLAKIDVTMNLSTRPGKKISEVFNLGLKAYAEAGYPEDWRLLHQGGLTGYAPREYLASMNSEAVIKVNQAFAWNPAIRGIKSEDTILVGEDGNEFITHTGEWVYVEVEHDGRTFQRPDILIR